MGEVLLQEIGLDPPSRSPVTIKAKSGLAAILNLIADNGEDNSDSWRIVAADGGDVTVETFQSGSWVAALTISSAGAVSSANYDGIVGANTPAAGEFTTLGASGLISADGGQIGFPASQSSSAGANVLDDYEEGTWTPGISFNSADVGVAYHPNNAGTYTKIGNRVWGTGRLFLTSKGSSNGAATIEGMPFTCKNTAGGFNAATISPQAMTFADIPLGDVSINTARMPLTEVTAAAGTVSTITDANFANGTEIKISFSYLTE